MKRSEAILAGAKLRPQGFGILYGNGKSCALGAACEGSGYPIAYQATARHVDAHLEKAFGAAVLNTITSCPYSDCDHPDDFAEMIITHLNDDHKWTRERIAEWLAGKGF